MTTHIHTIEIARPVRRVAFTYDFLRMQPVEPGRTNVRARNLAWLVEMITGASAWKHRQIDVSVVSPPIQTADFERAIGNPDAVADYQESPDHAWARRFDAQEPDIFATLFEQLSECDLIVGFELAPTIKRKLHAQGRPYINFYIHPLRFLRDLCFGATTNTPMIAAALRMQAIAQFEIDNQIRRFRALFLRHQRTTFSIPAGLPVLVGQTERDSVLIQGGRFVGWEDYADNLAQRLGAFDEIVFLEHPYRPSNAIILEYLRSVQRKTVLSTNANSYGVLFSSSNIPEILTLTSSLGVEAKSMGLATTFMLSDPRNALILPEVDLPEHGCYGHAVLAPPFWDTLLGARDPQRRVPEPLHRDDFFLGGNYVRKTMDSWSFQQLEGDVGTLTCRKTLVPSEGLTDQRRDALLGEILAEGTSLSPQFANTIAGSTRIELNLCDAPLRLGEAREVALNGHSANHYLAEGFHPCESWGAWSSGLRSELIIAVSSQVVSTHASVEITMRLHVLDTLMLRTPVLRVSYSGELVGYVFFRRSGHNQQTVRFAVTPKSTRCRIDLEMTDIDIPAKTGDSADNRSLGFGLTRLTLICASSEGGTTNATDAICHLWGVNDVDLLSAKPGLTHETNH